MTQRLNVVLVDDIDGSEAVETVSFALDGVDYEIDLNLPHAREIRAQLSPFVEKARKAAGSPGRPARQRRAGAGDKKNKEVRDWARKNGLQVSERGRIPANVVAEYETANSR
jgi:Lsr2